MPEPLSKDYLAEIRKRCDAATPGPWISSIEDRDHTSGSNVILRGVDRSEDDLELLGGTVADYDFIAHARQDVPKLLEEIERLRTLLGEKA
jgi:hypothetical protein